MQIDELMALAELYAGSAVRQCEAIGSGRAYDDAYAQSMSDRASLRAAIESLIAASAAPAAPQQAEPVVYRKYLDGVDAHVYRLVPRDDEADKWEPLYLHPPAAEVQRLRDAATRLVALWNPARPESASVVADAIDKLCRELEGQ